MGDISEWRLYYILSALLNNKANGMVSAVLGADEKCAHKTSLAEMTEDFIALAECSTAATLFEMGPYRCTSPDPTR